MQRLSLSVGDRPFAVLHPTPKYNYKRWHGVGWRELSHFLLSKGLQVVVTGGTDHEERAHLSEIFPDPVVGMHDFAGSFSLGEIGALISRAKLYVGPDTVTTHMAAALGIPTVALFGPSNPVKWGPWPRHHADDRNPYLLRGAQRAGNVILLQGPGECVPCMLEGCNRHISSHSQCLLDLSAREVQAAIETLLSPMWPEWNQ